MVRTLFFVAVCVCAQIVAKPTGFHCVAGQAKISKDVERGMRIKTRGKTIINWDDFYVKPKEFLIFEQDSAKSVVINRAMGAKSHVFGSIGSNGKVILISDQGIQIGRSAHIKTAGFIAATGKIDDAHFLSSSDVKITDLGHSKLFNQGTIETDFGDIILVSRHLINNGKLSAPNGHVGLAVGHEILIKPDGPEKIFIKPFPGPTSNSRKFAIENFNAIDALVCELKTERNPHASAICLRGRVNATQVQKKGGRLYLVAPGSDVDVRGDLTATDHIHIEARDAFFTKGKVQAKEVECFADIINTDVHSEIKADYGKLYLHAQKHCTVCGDLSALDGRLDVISVESEPHIEGGLNTGLKGVLNLLPPFEEDD